MLDYNTISSKKLLFFSTVYILTENSLSLKSRHLAVLFDIQSPSITSSRLGSNETKTVDTKQLIESENVALTNTWVRFNLLKPPRRAYSQP